MAKTKALISFAVSAKLICVFVFAYADCWFSHAAAKILMNEWLINGHKYTIWIGSFMSLYMRAVSRQNTKSRVTMLYNHRR